MPTLQLHHYGFLTRNTGEWLKEQEQLFGPPAFVSECFCIASQKVQVTFVAQVKGQVLIELVEPLPGNQSLEKMLQKGIGIYHCGYLTSHFDQQLAVWEAKGARPLTTFHSEAFGGRRCAFVLTDQLGLVELIEEGNGG